MFPASCDPPLRSPDARPESPAPMAVYTEVSDEELASFIASYGLGELLSFKGIAEGVENTNYIVHSDERLVHPDAVREARRSRRPAVFSRADGASRRARRHLPDAGARRQGRVTCASSPGGRRRSSPSSRASGCAARRPPIARPSATALAELHLGGGDFAMRRANALGLTGWRPLYERFARRAGEIAPDLAPFVEGELKFLKPTGRAACRGRYPRRLFPITFSFSVTGFQASSTSTSPATTRSPTTSPSASTPGASRKICRSTSPKGRRFLRGYEEVRHDRPQAEREAMPTARPRRGAALPADARLRLAEHPEGRAGQPQGSASNTCAACASTTACARSPSTASTRRRNERGEAPSSSTRTVPAREIPDRAAGAPSSPLATPARRSPAAKPDHQQPHGADGGDLRA